MFALDELLTATGGRLLSRKGARALARAFPVKGVSIDSRTIRKGEAFIAVKGDNFDGHAFIADALRRGASCVIQRSGKQVSASRGALVIEVEDTRKALGDIACYHRLRFDIPVIAVTGSNGKTTTKEMIARLLSGTYRVLKNEGTKNNDIGLPLALLRLNRLHDVVVLELGTNHFGEIEWLSRIARPDIGVITNIGPAHLAYLGTMRGALREKLALIRNLKKPGIAVLNADDELLRGEVLKKQQAPFTLGFGIRMRSDFWAFPARRSEAGRSRFLLASGAGNTRSKYGFTINTPGYYNIYNALAAIAVARVFGVGKRDIAERLSGFIFPKSRLEFIRARDTTFIDDAYNANPASLEQALQVLDNCTPRGRKIFVMGDMLELGAQAASFHRSAGIRAAGICDVFVTVGGLSRICARAALAAGLDKKQVFSCKDSLRAREVLRERVRPRKDDIVLVKGSRLMRMERVFRK